jgi:hypothetical protein
MPTISEVAASIVCRLADVEYIGIQNGFGYIEDMALFKDRVTHSTLALPLSGLTRRAIRVKLKESRERFGL